MYGYDDISKLKDKLDEVIDFQESIKADIIAEILSVKNEHIQKADKNIFFINNSNFKIVSSSPEYYNIEKQSQRIIEQLKGYENILTIKRKISEYILTEKIIINPKLKIEINEVLLNKLKEIEKKLKKLDEVK